MAKENLWTTVINKPPLEMFDSKEVQIVPGLPGLKQPSLMAHLNTSLEAPDLLANSTRSSRCTEDDFD